MARPRDQIEADHDAQARLREARTALVGTGYFGAAQVSDDIAPRITELATAARERLDQQTAEIERLTDSLIAEGARYADQRDVLADYGRTNKLASGRISELERELSAAQARSAEWRRLWRDRYRNLWGLSEQYRADLAAAQARAETAEAILDDWERKAGPGSPAEQVFGRQVVSVKFAVETLRSALAGDAACPLPEPEREGS